MITTKQTAVTEATNHRNNRETGTTEGAKLMKFNRRTATTVGILFLLTEVTALLGLWLYGPILNGPDYLVNGFAHQSQVTLGAIMELLLVGANIGTAVGLFPILRKYNEGLALGYLCFRVMEAVIITIGIVSVLALLTLSQAFAVTTASNASAFAALGTVLKGIHDWTFMLGPDLMLGVNTMMCGYLLYQSRLVPRLIGGMGMAGSALVVLAALLEMFGVIQQVSVWGALLGLPVFAYEVSLAVWLIVKGFNSSAIVATSAKTATNKLLSAA